MNFFWLVEMQNAMKENAEAHCDEHVRKMPIEAAQMLYTVLWQKDPIGTWRFSAPFTKDGVARGYKPVKNGHPVITWAGLSLTNYQLCVDYGLALCTEYTKRYKKVHDTERHLHFLRANPPELEDCGRTPVPLVVNKGKKKAITILEPDLRKACEIYRKFYITDKARFASYDHTPRPEWWENKTQLLSV